MTCNINKLNRTHIENFLVREKTGSVTVHGRDGFKTVNLFKNIDENKQVIAYLRSHGLDVFKRGTKEPERIRIVLEKAKWEEMKDIDPSLSGAKSMWD